MRTLEFKVKDQELQKNERCDFSGLVAGTEGYLKASFAFSGSGWDNCKKIASFWTGDLRFSKGEEYAVLLDETNSCIIPSEALVNDIFLVSLTGVKQGYKIKTGKIEVRQEVY